MTKKRKIIKYIILTSFAFCFAFLTGCNNSNNNIIKILELNLSKVEQTLDNVQTIDTSDLIINDFMSEEELNKIDVRSFELSSNNDNLNDYVNKLSILNNNVYTTVSVNNENNSLKSQILSKCAQLKLILYDCDNYMIASNAQNALSDINKNLMENNTRVSLTRNEINNYLSSVKKLKEQYNKKTDQLNSRYAKLQGALNTRNSYYNNMLYDLEQIGYILCDECDVISTKKEKKETKKTWLNKNIDTYENAGNNFFGLPNGQIPYSHNNYYGYPNGYGVGMYNGYGNIYGGYGMGMQPYAYGWGYRMPNINTYGSYKNIDTYRRFKNEEKYYYNDNFNNSDDKLKIYEDVNGVNNADTLNNNSIKVPEILQPKKIPRPVPLDDGEISIYNKNAQD